MCSWSATSWSVNLPGKVIRWSVAMEPVTAMRTGRLLLRKAKGPRERTLRDGVTVHATRWGPSATWYRHPKGKGKTTR
ncbi:hypothetical protein GCM10020227_14960 [Streptomyces flavovirens]